MKRERHYTEAEAAQLEMLRKQKAEIQAEINRISRAESMRESRRKSAQTKPRKSEAVKLFGKRFRDLSPEEKRAYWRAATKKSRGRPNQ